MATKSNQKVPELASVGIKYRCELRLCEGPKEAGDGGDALFAQLLAL